MTNLAQVAGNQPSKHATFNDICNTLSPAGLLGRCPAAITGRTWACFGGVVWANGGWRTVKIAPPSPDPSIFTISLLASTTNYVELDLGGDGTDPFVQTNTTGFTAGRIPLYEVTTNGSGITAETDRRLVLNLEPQGQDPQVVAFPSDSPPTLTVDALAGNTVFVGTLTDSFSMEAPLHPFLGAELLFVLEQDGAGGHVITWDPVFVKAADGAGAAGERGTIGFVYDGANWVQLGPALEWS